MQLGPKMGGVGDKNLGTGHCHWEANNTQQDRQWGLFEQRELCPGDQHTAKQDKGSLVNSPGVPLLANPVGMLYKKAVFGVCAQRSPTVWILA